MRYQLQPDDYCCGPIAIINANIWKYGNSTYVDLDNLRKICKLNKERGVERWNLDLSSLGIKRNKPIYNIEKIKKSLSDENQCIILEYSFEFDDGEIGAHYVLVMRNQKDKYIVINTMSKKLEYTNKTYGSWKQFYENYLWSNPKDEKGLEYPCAWIVKK